MILVDTSVWVDHLRAGDMTLSAKLDERDVLMHPFVLGEVALGSLPKRELTLDALRDLPRAEVADAEEVLQLIERHGLQGRGIGYVDAHLLAAAKLQPGASLWTRDRRLLEAAERMALAFAARLH